MTMTWPTDGRPIENGTRVKLNGTPQGKELFGTIVGLRQLEGPNVMVRWDNHLVPSSISYWPDELERLS